MAEKTKQNEELRALVYQNKTVERNFGEIYMKLILILNVVSLKYLAF